MLPSKRGPGKGSHKSMPAVFQVGPFTQNVNWAFDGFNREIRDRRGHISAWKVRFCV